MQVGISYLHISFRIHVLNRNSIINEMNNFLNATFIHQNTNNKKQFLKILEQRKEIEHYTALSKDKLGYHNLKLGFLVTV